MDEIADDRSRLIDKEGPKTHVYKRRWWIVAVFCLFGLDQAMVWGTWGPIAESAEIVFGWSDFNAALPTNLANTCFIISVLPMCMLSDTKGLRLTMLLCTGLMSIVTLLRCISLDPDIITVTAYICGLGEGIAATAPYACPPLVASVWFPPKQRPLATAFISFFNYFGLSMNFIIGPRLVPGPIWETLYLNNTGYDDAFVDTDLANISYVNDTALSLSRVVTNTNGIKNGIHNLLYTHAGLAVASFLLVLVYFPPKPPSPPSITASIQRVNYRHALKQIIRNRALWLVVIAGAMPIGVVGVWSVVIDVILKPIGVTQIDAGWIGFWNTLIGCFSGIVIAKFSELFRRRRKLVLIIFFSCAAICCANFALITMKIIPFSLPGLYATCILMGVCLNGTIPLFYDISAEASYPVAEGVTGGVFTMTNNVFGVTFLYLIAIPNIGTAWLNWVLLGAICAAIPLLCLFPETYKRSDIDMRRTSTAMVTDAA